MAAEPAIDLLQRFVPAICQDEVSGTAGGGTSTGTDAEAIELSLDLSLGGERREKKLVRSSTVASVGLTMFAGEELRGVGRTCSLPAEAEEELRKRKEIQGMKRMEAKRRRLEKRESRSGSGSGSQGSGSSVLSDLESRPSQGLSTSKEVKSPSPVLDQANHNATTVVTGKLIKASNETNNEPSKDVAARDQDMEKKMLESMPCVSTPGEGPNGKRIHGFLYKYGKCEEVRILCVCHGIFLTPAEFVKHAGGGDVANPLRHIVVSSPSSSALL